ncbi:MAG: amidase [Betaproteobacteria bacterium]|nr:amidase [Betaproteobacteria bacterium]
MRKELARLSLLELAEGLREARFSAEDYVRVCLAAISESEARIRAWAFLDPQYALRQAKRADDRQRQGETSGALAGVPLGVKDIIATVDMPTQLGSPIFSGHQPRLPAECVERIEASGGYVLGKTVTTEFAYLTPSKTHNPWQLSHTPGGSSAGSAAAVAAGHVPAALGTQTHGSVIRPAAFCGVVGYKPSKDLLPYRGIFYLAPSLDQLGLFARRVEDAALVAATLAEPRQELPVQISAAPENPLFVLIEDLPWVQPDADMRSALENTAFLLRQAGAQVVSAPLPGALQDAAAVHRTILLFEAAKELGELQDRERERISPQMNVTLDAGRRIGEGDYLAALERRRELVAHFDAFLANAHALLLPPAPGAAPASLASTGDPSFCTLFSLTGMPALTLPVGLSPQGLPLGLQLGARLGQDGALLAVARWCEGVLSFQGLPGLK